MINYGKIVWKIHKNKSESFIMFLIHVCYISKNTWNGITIFVRWRQTKKNNISTGKNRFSVELNLSKMERQRLSDINFIMQEYITNPLIFLIRK